MYTLREWRSTKPGALLQPCLTSLKKQEYRCYYDRGQYLYAVQTFPQSGSVKRVNDIRCESIEAAKGQTYETFVRALPHIKKFGEEVLARLEKQYHLVSQSAILRVDIGMEEHRRKPFIPIEFRTSTSSSSIADMPSFVPHGPFPYRASVSEIVLSPKRWVRVWVNEVTSTLEINFLSTNTTFPIVPLVAQNVQTLLHQMFNPAIMSHGKKEDKSDVDMNALEEESNSDVEIVDRPTTSTKTKSITIKIPNRSDEATREVERIEA